MNHNKLITEKYLNDFERRFEKCAEHLKIVCKILLQEDKIAASKYFVSTPEILYKKGELVPQHYKSLGTLKSIHEKKEPNKPSVSEKDKFIVFRKNKYQCSYTGIKLITHPIIELLSYILPNEFPYNNPPNGSDKDEKNTHLLVWALWPSVDHIIPVSKGGLNMLDNYTIANSKVNMFKAKFHHEEIGLEMKKHQDSEWNGLEYEYHLLFKKYKSDIPNSRLKKFEMWNRIMM